MKEAFINGDDIHTATAMKVFGVEADQVDSLMRGETEKRLTLELFMG